MAQEKNFENRIKAYLKEHGIWYIKYWGGGAYTRAGVPDILACVNGHFVAIEVKAEGGRVSELQLYEQRKINEAGGISLIVRPSDFDTLKEILSNLM